MTSRVWRGLQPPARQAAEERFLPLPYGRGSEKQVNRARQQAATKRAFPATCLESTFEINSERSVSLRLALLCKGLNNPGDLHQVM